MKNEENTKDIGKIHVKYFSKDTLKKKSISLVSHLQHARFFTKSGMEIWLENCS